MNNLMIDTLKLKSCGEEIMKLTEELNETFDSLYSRIYGMNDKTREWIGNGALNYINRCRVEKAQYIKLINILKEYGQTLIDASFEYDKNIKLLRDRYD